MDSEVKKVIEALEGMGWTLKELSIDRGSLPSPDGSFPVRALSLRIYRAIHQS